MKLRFIRWLLAFLLAFSFAVSEQDAKTFLLPGDNIENFTADQTDGTLFSLESALNDHKAVIFCRFDIHDAAGLDALSELEQALHPLKESVAVVLCTEQTDGSEATFIRNDFGIHRIFVLNNDSAPLFCSYADNRSFIIIIDRFGVCVYSEYESSICPDEVFATLEKITAEDYPGNGSLVSLSPESCGASDGGENIVYTISLVDENGMPIQGVMVNICTDTTCSPSFSDENGLITFSSAPYCCKLHLLKVPKGFTLDRDAEYLMNTANILIVIPHNE